MSQTTTKKGNNNNHPILGRSAFFRDDALAQQERRSTSEPEPESKQGHCLFLGTAVRKAICAQNVGRTQRINLAPVELKTKEAKENRIMSQAREEPQPRPALASFLDLASIETPVRSPHPDHEGWLRWTYDTGASSMAFPLDARIGTETQANDCSHKTASLELISDCGGLRAQGTTEYGYGVTFHGRKADVHNTLISASKVRYKSHVAVADSNGGYIILSSSRLAIKIQHFVQKEIAKELGAIVS